MTTSQRLDQEIDRAIQMCELAIKAIDAQQKSLDLYIASLNAKKGL